MIILGTGSRAFQDPRMMEDILDEAIVDLNPRDVQAVHGAARGFDSYFAAACHARGFGVQGFPAEGFPDPLARNRYMVDLVANANEEYREPVIVVAYATRWASGTGHCARYARSKGLFVVDYGTDTRSEARWA